MVDLSKTIAPKSDQLNADDLIAGPRTITITAVGPCPGGASDQPIAIHFEGDEGRPYKPCKTMRRVLVFLWGADGDAYVGRSLTLYRDPEVKFGGKDVGGIRICHASHIEKDTPVPITMSRTQRTKQMVGRLDPAQPKPEKEPGDIKQALARIAGVSDVKMLEGVRGALLNFAWSADEIAEIKEALVTQRADLSGSMDFEPEPERETA